MSEISPQSIDCKKGHGCGQEQNEFSFVSENMPMTQVIKLL